MRRLLAYAQLVRLPNVFTALADICLAALVTGALPERWLPFLLLCLASACLYCAGMVWNDYFDRHQDERERPFRPIPSGRVTSAAAARLGILLMIVGVGCAVAVDILLASQDASAPGGYFRWQATALAGLLVLAIFLYDAWLKRTSAGPVSMGICRMLNVLLGLSVYPEGMGSWGLPLALVVGIYIAGVTWFARSEARESSQRVLAGAAAVMLGGVLLALVLPPLYRPAGNPDDPSYGVSAAVWWGQALFPYLLLAFAAYVGVAVGRAVLRPLPERVQAAVRRAVLGLVALDAILATGLAGPLGLALVLLLVPALYLGRWVYST
jgi:4-hydroxybenzoate polyprenyltransferase